MPVLTSSAVEDERRKQPSISLHNRILADMRGSILSGTWPPGYRIPYEHELKVTYGCSRMTVNKVMTQLVETGLIERRRRAGSFVRRPRLQSAVLEIRDVRVEVAALGLPYHYVVDSLAIRPTTALDAERLSIECSGQVLDVTCLHFAATRVFCVEQRIIDIKAVPDAATATFEEEAPGPWLVRLVPWTAAEHRISAWAADEDMAAICGIDIGAPCLVIERRTWRSDQPVTVVRLTYPGESHELVARFAPDDGASRM